MSDGTLARSYGKVLEGSLLMGVASGGKTVEQAKEPAEAITNEFRLQTKNELVWLESNGTLEEKRASLKFDAAAVTLEGASDILTLAGSPKWGIYTQ
jgi:hypothetical protein